MNVGMLWLDADQKRTLEEKVKRAAEHYHQKYGRFPELCYVHTGMVEEACQFGEIKVEPAKNVLNNHFWLGMTN